MAMNMIGATGPMNDTFAFLKENAVSTMIVAAISAFFGWLGTRSNKAPDVQTSLNAGFDGIVTHTTALLEQARTDAANLRSELDRVRGLVDQYEETFEELNRFVIMMHSDIQKLVRVIHEAGLTPPPLSTPPGGPNITRPSAEANRNDRD